MPRKITNVNELTDNAAAMAEHRCELCGAPLSGRGDYNQPRTGDACLATDPLEAIQRIALYMADDWKACAVLLLCIAAPGHPVNWIAQRLTLSMGATCEARQRAAHRFPELAAILGLKARQADAQQRRFQSEATEKENHQPALF